MRDRVWTRLERRESVEGGSWKNKTTRGAKAGKQIREQQQRRERVTEETQ